MGPRWVWACWRFLSCGPWRVSSLGISGAQCWLEDTEDTEDAEDEGPARPSAARCLGNVLIENSSHRPRKLRALPSAAGPGDPSSHCGRPPTPPAPRFGQAVHVGGLPFLLSPLLGRTAGHNMGVEVGRAGQAQAHGRLPGKMARSFHTSSLCKLAQEAAWGPQGRWPPGLQLVLRSDWRCRASSPDFCAGLQPAGHREAPPRRSSQQATERPHPQELCSLPGTLCQVSAADSFHRWWGRPAASASLCLWELRPPGNWPRRSSGAGPPWPKGPQLCCFPRNLG